jgi:NADH-quinone oxidoreductase subunit I
VVDDDGQPQHLPWEDWREGDDLNTSGWVRATAPGGAARYEGTVHWSGELGYGVRAPESGQSAEISAQESEDRGAGDSLAHHSSVEAAGHSAHKEHGH